MEEKDYLTVKEFAERAGISTQRVYQLLAKDWQRTGKGLAKDLQSTCKVVANTKYIHISALERFENKPICKDLQSDLPSDLQSICKSLQDQIDTLKQHNSLLEAQINVKDEQLAEKDKQINALTDSLQATTNALTSAQALHAGTIQGQLTMQSERSEDVQPVKEKGVFFSRLFKKSK